MVRQCEKRSGGDWTGKLIVSEDSTPQDRETYISIGKLCVTAVRTTYYVHLLLYTEPLRDRTVVRMTAIS